MTFRSARRAARRKRRYLRLGSESKLRVGSCMFHACYGRYGPPACLPSTKGFRRNRYAPGIQLHIYDSTAAQGRLGRPRGCPVSQALWRPDFSPRPRDARWKRAPQQKTTTTKTGNRTRPAVHSRELLFRDVPVDHGTAVGVAPDNDVVIVDAASAGLRGARIRNRQVGSFRADVAGERAG